jgi:hypothetical protein
MRRFCVLTLAGAIGLAVIVPSRAQAHHGAGEDDWALWDQKQMFEVCGVVTKSEFVNPHVLVHVQFTIKDGTPLTWTFTSHAPNSIVRLGFTRQRFLELFASGTQVLVQGIPKADGMNRSAARTIIRTDGQALADGYFANDRATNQSLPSPRMRCLTPADTRTNIRPPEFSYKAWQRSRRP